MALVTSSNRPAGIGALIALGMAGIKVSRETRSVDFCGYFVPFAGLSG
ncbi:MAG TPA: hypothetical protein VJT72_19870 [Pseudonocardiaceae bacterium]|nr:hypothetical protein [Pseudonocardiaceae bacterium]